MNTETHISEFITKLQEELQEKLSSQIKKIKQDCVNELLKRDEEKDFVIENLTEKAKNNLKGRGLFPESELKLNEFIKNLRDNEYIVITQHCLNVDSENYNYISITNYLSYIDISFKYINVSFNGINMCYKNCVSSNGSYLIPNDYLYFLTQILKCHKNLDGFDLHKMIGKIEPLMKSYASCRVHLNNLQIENENLIKDLTVNNQEKQKNLETENKTLKERIAKLENENKKLNLQLSLGDMYNL